MISITEGLDRFLEEASEYGPRLLERMEELLTQWALNEDLTRGDVQAFQTQRHGTTVIFEAEYLGKDAARLVTFKITGGRKEEFEKHNGMPRYSGHYPKSANIQKYFWNGEYIEDKDWDDENQRPIDKKQVTHDEDGVELPFPLDL